MTKYFIAAAFIVLIALCVIGIIYAAERIKASRMRKTLAMENRVDLGELFIALEFIIKTESDLYEQYLENNVGKDFTRITNTEFNNIYQELSMRCLKAISTQFWESVECYVTREVVQTYVTQRVFNYLADKVEEGGE